MAWQAGGGPGVSQERTLFPSPRSQRSVQGCSADTRSCLEAARGPRLSFLECCAVLGGCRATGGPLHGEGGPHRGEAAGVRGSERLDPAGPAAVPDLPRPPAPDGVTA